MRRVAAQTVRLDDEPATAAPASLQQRLDARRHGQGKRNGAQAGQDRRRSKLGQMGGQQLLEQQKREQRGGEKDQENCHPQPGMFGIRVEHNGVLR